MTVQLSRRLVLRGSLLVLATAALPAQARPALQLPAGTMRLTRTLERELIDSKVITVEREWAVQFLRTARYIEVRGEQISARVDAPPNLADLAKVEEQRQGNDLFPLMLSDDGMLMAGGDEVQSEALDRAIEIAGDLIAHSTGDDDERRLARLHLLEMQRAVLPLFKTLPKDLFFPVAAPINKVRAIDLPGGKQGAFEFTYAAQAVPEKGWLAQAERRIVTRIPGSSRTSSESWTLAQM